MRRRRDSVSDREGRDPVLDSSNLMDWLATAQRKDIVTRAMKVSAIVGTILVAINQGDALLQGIMTPAVAAKIALTYCVPYAVSTYASVEATRSAGK